MKWLPLFFCLMALTSRSGAQARTWSESEQIPAGGLANPYDLDEKSYQANRRQGLLHAQIYPVRATGMLIPDRPLRTFIETPSANPLRWILQQAFRGLTWMRSARELFAWIGLHPYPLATDEGIYQVPVPEDHRPDDLMGLGRMQRHGATGFTFSCAACHSARLFGKTVLGMTNRFPRANEVFTRAARWSPYYRAHLFRRVTGATAPEMALMNEAQIRLRAVGTRIPLNLGLDTSLAQVALSLARRSPGPLSLRDPYYEQNPRPTLLDHQPADSKPAVWWNVKYKNRWLSDGSVVSGNPIFTNILWNELGRGADLDAIEDWLDANPQTIQELTTAVFSSEAPRITDFFPAEKFDLDQLRRGQTLFQTTCARCHGVYEKAWDQPQADKLSAAERLRTIRVLPLALTPVVNVGTDPLRAEGMSALARLNELEISQKHEVLIKPQTGYVPPPLVGIWARWPYFHNNSAPSLCAVLTAGPSRPVSYFAGEAEDRQRDFDDDCNGYPLGDRVPRTWRQSEFFYDTRRAGMGRMGHDEGIFLRDGNEIFTSAQKKDLIRFLQTL